MRGSRAAKRERVSSGVADDFEGAIVYFQSRDKSAAVVRRVNVAMIPSQKTS